MYKIDNKSFGFAPTFNGEIPEEQMMAWVEDSKQALEKAGDSFGVFVDMRGLATLTPEAKATMEEGRKLYKMKDMVRSAVVVDSATLVLQFERIAKETGIYEWEKYFDASAGDDWEKAAVDWIENEVDPKD